MAVWSTRTSGYKMGVGVLFVGSAFYLIGFASPFWFDIEGGDTHVYSGLWMGCVEKGEENRCAYSTGNEPGWFKAVQAMQCVGLIGMIAAGVYAVVANVRQNPLSHNRLLEGLAAFTGASGLIGCIIFVGESTSRTDTVDVDVEQYFGWSFGLSTAGGVLFLITAPIIYSANRAAPATPGGIILSGAPVAVTIQQGTGYPPPGQGYLPQPGYPAQPVYGYDQGSASALGGYAPAAVPPHAGYAPAAPQAGYSPAAPQAGYSPAAPQAGYAQGDYKANEGHSVLNASSQGQQ